MLRQSKTIEPIQTETNFGIIRIIRSTFPAIFVYQVSLSLHNNKMHKTRFGLLPLKIREIFQ